MNRTHKQMLIIVLATLSFTASAFASVKDEASQGFKD